MKIIVFGANGMLGTYMCKYLKQCGHEVHPYTRSDYDVCDAVYPDDLNILDLDWAELIINCAGVIKQRDYNVANMIQANGVWPHLLSDHCKGLAIKMIHISSDCVFSGKTGGYNEHTYPDAYDWYGRSKLIGEPRRSCMVIRTSIIGEEKGEGKSLFSWVKSHAGQTIQGYTNHFWNGVTCLRLVQCIDQIIQTNDYWTDRRHIFSETVSKYQLVDMINMVYGFGIQITPTYADPPCDRTLKTGSLLNRHFDHPSLREQIYAMKRYNIEG
jgi:dTDP-4-dehydrorhamnose reductase